MFAEVPDDGDVVGHAGQLEPLVFEPGIVGWNDGGKHYDADDGVTLVKVTLFRGRDATQPLKPGQAGGQRVLCRIGGGLFRIPKPGTGVMVGFPSWGSAMPGAGLIVSTVEQSPDIQFSERKAKMDLGDEVDLVIKARSITLSDYGNRFLHIGPDGGIQVQEADGTGILIKDGSIVICSAEGGAMKTVIIVSKDALQATQASGNVINVKGGNVTMLGQQCSMVFGSMKLGAAATPATPAHYGPAPVASLPSTSIFIQP
jgi:hypothetical protein